jgi:hypothetical protein
MPELPAQPAGWLERKAIAQDRVSAARQAHRQLEAQHAASARAVAQATTAQQGAIARLLRDRGETLAIETEAGERLALALRDELTALGRVHLTTDAPGWPSRLPAPAHQYRGVGRIAEALTWSGAPRP